MVSNFLTISTPTLTQL